MKNLSTLTTLTSFSQYLPGVVMRVPKIKELANIAGKKLLFVEKKPVETGEGDGIEAVGDAMGICVLSLSLWGGIGLRCDFVMGMKNKVVNCGCMWFWRSKIE